MEDFYVEIFDNDDFENSHNLIPEIDGDGIEFKIDPDEYDTVYSLQDIVGVGDEEFNDFTMDDGYDTGIFDDTGEEEYIGVYLNDKILTQIQKVMDLLGYYHEGETGDEGIIADFYEKFGSELKYDSTFYGNTKQKPYTLKEFTDDIDYGIRVEYAKTRDKVQEILPYSINSNDLFLPNEYIRTLASDENNEIENATELLDCVKTVDTLVKAHNEKTGEKVDTIYLTKRNNSMNDEQADDIYNTFVKVYENLQENPISDDFYENMEKLKILGFDKAQEIEKNGITISIVDRKMKEGKVKIRRWGKGGVESGWVKIDNLANNFEKTLFERRMSRFNTFKK